MDNIIISGIAMPSTTSLEISGEIEAKDVTMASGKIVRDVIGWRTKLTAKWEWLPVGVLSQVVSVARSGGFASITYPDPSGITITANFQIEIGSQKIFRFVSCSPYWYNVDLVALAQEVTT